MAYLPSDYTGGQLYGFKRNTAVPEHAVLDRSCSLTRGLVGAFLFNENGGAPKNYAQPARRATLSASGWRREITQGGRGFSTDGVNGILDYNCHNDLSCPNGFTVSAYSYISDSAGHEIVNNGSFVQGQGWGVRLVDNIGQPVLSVLLREPADKDSPFNPSTEYSCGGPYDGDHLFQRTNSWLSGVYIPERELRVYGNGWLLGTTTVGAGKRTVNGVGSVGWCTGRNSNFTGSADQPNRVYAVFIHERPLSPSEVEALHSDYTQMFTWPGKLGIPLQNVLNGDGSAQVSLSSVADALRTANGAGNAQIDLTAVADSLRSVYSGGGASLDINAAADALRAVFGAATVNLVVSVDAEGLVTISPEGWIHNLDTARPPKVLLLTRRSTKTLRYRVVDVPAPAEVAKSYLMLKRSWTDPDSEALVAKAIATTPVSDGRIVAGSTAESAYLEFSLHAHDFDEIPEGEYVIGVKSVLDNGLAYVHDGTVTRVHVLAPAVEAVV